MLDFELDFSGQEELKNLFENLPKFNETQVICVYNQKGGVGKTTSSVNMANCLANYGYKTLLIDGDGQGSASFMLNVNIDDDTLPCLGTVIYDYVFHGEQIRFRDIKDAIITPFYYKNNRRRDTIGWVEEQIEYGFDLLPSSGISLSTCELALTSTAPYVHKKPETTRALFAYVVNLIKERMDYDFIIIDTNPSLGIWSVNALTASQYLVIPSPMEYMSTAGIQTIVNRVEEIRKYVPTFSILGVLPTMFSKKRLIDAEIRDDTSALGNNLIPLLPIFNTSIPENINLSKKVIKQGRILTLEKGPIRDAYYLTTLEVIDAILKLKENKNNG